MKAMPMIDVVQASELLEVCAAEIASENSAAARGPEPARRARLSLAARALAKRQLTIAHLARRPLGRWPHGVARTDEPTITLGAVIVFRTADRLGRAGASTAHTLDAVYRAVHRYVDVLPSTLQDRADKIAVDELLGAPYSLSTRVPGPERGDGPGIPTGAIGDPAARR
jgi:hypothetical protein